VKGRNLIATMSSSSTPLDRFVHVRPAAPPPAAAAAAAPPPPPPPPPSAADVRRELERVRRNLYGSVLPFWLRYSVDAAHGGFFNNLGREGGVFDTRKHVWLQGRQCWMFARVANAHTDAELEALFARYAAARPRGPARNALAEPQPLTRTSLVASALRGVRFLLEHAVDAATGHVAFALTREGAVALHQRKMFSASFLVMALAEVSKAAREPALFREAVSLLERMLCWARFPAALGKPGAPGAAPFEPLNVPMIVLNVISEVASCVPEGGWAGAPAAAFFIEERRWAAARIAAHWCAERRCVLENVLPGDAGGGGGGGGVSGARFDFSSPDGRLCNPGHAIEAGWFLLEWAQEQGDAAAEALAREIIACSWSQGWDTSAAGGGGFLYFVDVDGHTPTQLEWSMKLWWPLNEAMIALSRATPRLGGAGGDGTSFARYVAAADWAFAHLADEEGGGEWFGYADRDGRVTHDFKGGPYKGCFHVPRALLFVEQAFEKLLQGAEGGGEGGK